MKTNKTGIMTVLFLTISLTGLSQLSFEKAPAPVE
jgi:hypothetical protein